MKLYQVSAEVTVSVRCLVHADSPEEAIEKASDCEMGSFCDAINGQRDKDDGVWLGEELDGEPHMKTATAEEVDE